MSTTYLAVRLKLYEVIYRVAFENLSARNSVLLDIPHVTQSRDKVWKNRIIRMSKQTGAKLRVLRCVCSEEVLRNRMVARREPRDKWKIEHWDRFLQREPINFEVPFPFLDINTERSIKWNVEEAIRYIMS